MSASPPSPSRALRSLRFLALICTALLAAAACGSSGAPSSATAASTVPNAGSTFPASVTHKFGTTVVPSAPQRVVSLGYTDQDAILALGVVPVAIREFTGNRPSATWPWAQDELQGQQPQVLNGEINLETLAALRPDLIVGVSAGMTREQYDTYSRIAPTIAQPEGFVDYGAPWQDATRLIGAALGKSNEAEKLVTDLESRFAAVRSDNAEFAGKKAVVAARSSLDAANYFVWSSQDSRGRFLSSLGFQIPPEFDQLAGDRFYADISAERLNLLDQSDLVVWITIPGTEGSEIERQPGYPALRVGREGRVITLTEEQGVALSFGSVLSLPSLLDSLPREIAGRLAA
ncbi:iron-siderophore ABC transporter substrate-binding protein [Pseudonocardia bannensis]|uniref:Iron-siderophore ABC transporter substrate-binding protein n=1 Tax=Pseudonocardia bannensis TaxID=630973 RepID=A0A848DJA8_9PSEU|nr:iron-siderophore ABC transporter substrate-binding protein [Pseudonocardia bannensis]NMH92616.1 iron-siderophore ABC transporter substrate-binding protein [Pseudonocardia bannensis]